MAEQIQETVEIEDTAQQQASVEVNPTAAPQQPVMGCTGDCKNCNPIQRGYCASQIAYNMQNAVARVEGAMATMAQTIAALAAKVETLQAQLEAQKKETAQLEFFAPDPETEKSEKPKKCKK